MAERENEELYVNVQVPKDEYADFKKWYDEYKNWPYYRDAMRIPVRQVRTLDAKECTDADTIRRLKEEKERIKEKYKTISVVAAAIAFGLGIVIGLLL